MTCLENKKKKKRRKRVWSRSWLGKRGRYGLPIIQGELESEDASGFRGLLRMNVQEFEHLLELVSPHINRTHTHLRRAITARERLSVMLRFLATGESFASLSFQYKIGRSTVSGIIQETCEALYLVLKDIYMKTPVTEVEWREVAKGFQERWQFPHCLGAIDGKHITILPPANSGSTFRNYKPHFSVLLMAVADSKYRFLYAHVGTQGRVSDGGHFAHSDLREAMDKNILNIPSAEPLPGTNIEMPYMFVADETFPLCTDLMNPYPSRHLTHDQRIYNYRLSRAKRVIENAFGILSNRWRVFLSTIHLDPVAISKITMACLALHNYMQAHAPDTYIPQALIDTEDAEHQIIPGGWRNDAPLPSKPVSHARNGSTPAKDQREILKAYFISPAGSVPWQEHML